MRRFAVAAIVLLLSAAAASAQDDPLDLAGLTLEELLNLRVTTASRKEQIVAETPAAVYVITHDDIRRSGLTTLPEVLRLAPGVHVAQLNSNKWAISIRGFNALYANKLLVLVDGRSVYNRMFGGVSWEIEDLVLDDVERIEVIRGPGAAMWGANAVNGVINIVTRSSSDTEGVFTKISAGTADAAATVRYGAAIPHGSFRVFSQASNRGQFLSVTDPNTSASDDWYHLVSGARGDWTLGSNSVILHGKLHSNRTNAQWLDLSPGSTGTTAVDERSSLTSGYLLGRWTRKAGSGRSIQVQSYVERVHRREPVGDYDRHAADVDVQYHLRSGERQDINFGAGYRTTTEALDGANGYLLSPSRSTEQLFSAFVQDEVSLAAGQLKVTGGARVEHADYSGTSLQPTARAMWHPARGHYLWAAVSRALRTPTLSERHVRVDYPAQRGPGGFPFAARLTGNPDLKSERLISNEAGYRLDLNATAFIDVTAFFGQYADLRTTQPLAPFVEFAGSAPVMVVPVQFHNLLDARTRGLEVAGHWQPGSDWRVDASYSLFDVQPRPHPLNADAGAATTDGTVPSTQWYLHTGGRIGRRVIVDGALFRVGRIASLDVPAYTRLDARVEVRLARQFSLALAGRNLGSRSHVEFPGVHSNLTTSRVPRSADISFVWRR